MSLSASPPPPAPPGDCPPPPPSMIAAPSSSQPWPSAATPSNVKHPDHERPRSAPRRRARRASKSIMMKKPRKKGGDGGRNFSSLSGAWHGNQPGDGRFFAPSFPPEGGVGDRRVPALERRPGQKAAVQVRAGRRCSGRLRRALHRAEPGQSRALPGRSLRVLENWTRGFVAGAQQMCDDLVSRHGSFTLCSWPSPLRR